ncbi:hypothetical protein D3C72_1513920 [compost metagenome]
MVSHTGDLYPTYISSHTIEDACHLQTFHFSEHTVSYTGKLYATHTSPNGIENTAHLQALHIILINIKYATKLNTFYPRSRSTNNVYGKFIHNLRLYKTMCT